ncbi:hypothetical protein J2128_000841 [Methanomicrobium sp. W14]|uniref:hypothetical protein n=1 Tax=Methanomicrobium sp. W14 TaxID=2817839 RepID=UPI001AE6A132|nr:hypothetical protein [Methanomicrobium sp. W14]MBP2132920.1 hypothetical protein [Methanomicrobium sp. W14]
MSEKDLEIFRKAAPEYNIDLCPSSGVDFRSVLPPLANHISKDDEDFRERILKLSEKDWKYLTELILKGDENISCLSRETLCSVIECVQKNVSADDARRIETIYELSSCDMI